MFTHPPIERLDWCPLKSVPPSIYCDMKRENEPVHGLTVEHSDEDWKISFRGPWTQQMQPGTLAKGFVAVVGKPGQQPVWRELETCVAVGPERIYSITDKLTEFLEQNNAMDISFYYGGLFVWASLKEDVECESHLPLALGNAVKKAELVMEANGRDISDGVVIVGTVLNPRIMGVAPEDNQQRNIELLEKVYPQMITVLESNKFPGRAAVFQTFELRNMWSNDESNKVYHALSAFIRATNAKNRPVEIMTTTRQMETLQDGTTCLITASNVPEKAPQHSARCANPLCTKVQGSQMTSKMVCGGCKSVHYCDKDCQKGHWQAHKPLCAKMKQGRQGVKNESTPLLRPVAQRPEGNTTIQISMPPNIMALIEDWDRRYNRAEQDTDGEGGGLHGLD